MPPFLKIADFKKGRSPITHVRGATKHCCKTFRDIGRLPFFSSDPHLAASRVSEFSRHRYAWEFAEESYQAANELVYQNGHVHDAQWSRVESHELAVADVPAISQQSLDQAYALVERRIALACYGLAERLKFIVSRDNERVDSAGKVASPTRLVQPARRFVR